jgi:hypothetical protein
MRRFQLKTEGQPLMEVEAETIEKAWKMYKKQYPEARKDFGSARFNGDFYADVTNMELAQKGK